MDRIVTLVIGILAAAALGAGLSCAAPDVQPPQRTFVTPEEGARVLVAAVKAGNIDELRRIVGPEGDVLVPRQIRPRRGRIAKSSLPLLPSAGNSSTTPTASERSSSATSSGPSLFRW